MGIKVIDLDTENLLLIDFMKAVGYEPTGKNGSLLTYKSPYSANGNIIVDVAGNTWYDSDNPNKYNGGIHDLAGEIIISRNKLELDLFIAAMMKKVMDFKTYEVMTYGDKSKADMVVVTPVSKRESTEAPAKIWTAKSDVKTDINDIPMTDFMKAIGFEPLIRVGNLLMYDCPYAASEPIRTVVDKEKNCWYDTEDYSYYGDIYRLAAEITCKDNRSELTRYITTQMKKLERYKSCEFMDRYGREGAKVFLTGFTVSDPGLLRQPQKVEPHKGQNRQEQPGPQPPKQKRKMRF
ncbi:hypothetical protein [Xylanibacter rodentium]|uniref:hypothetical protein n=1 Tax=Xylanibacter rodentium TaxID=2736289 RepID=UPI0025752A93|nr:hypothetical protein [Xylanibacter rodentium]